MSAELTMPKLSDSMADAVIIKWLKSPGEGFRRGDALMEVETDKATVVYEAEVDGTIAAILVPEGGTAAVGQPIAELGSANGAPAVAGRPNATPVARRAALELGISLHGIDGTGPGGRITQEDVQRAAGGAAPAATPAAPAAVAPGDDARGSARVAELTPTQSTIARRMVESATTIPVF